LVHENIYLNTQKQWISNTDIMRSL